MFIKYLYGMKMGKIYNKVISELSDKQYNLVKTEYRDSRIIMSDDVEINYSPTPNQATGVKPKGLWYGIGTAWLDWVRSEMPEWESDNVFLLDIDESRVKVIRNFQELMEFDKEYGVESERYANWRSINWGRVSNDWGGVEIAPYIYKARYDVSWYYGWDIASGCIWGNGVIRGIKKIG